MKRVSVGKRTAIRAIVCTLLPLTVAAHAAPIAPAWGVLGTLPGTVAEAADQTYVFTWKVPNQVLILSNVTSRGITDFEFRLDGNGPGITAFYRDKVIGSVTLPAADSWLLTNPAAASTTFCRVRESQLDCERKDGSFTMIRVEGKDILARVEAARAQAPATVLAPAGVSVAAASAPVAVTPVETEAEARAALARIWGPFASFLRWNGTQFVATDAIFAAIEQGQLAANVQFRWTPAIGNKGASMQEIWDRTAIAITDWSVRKDGVVVSRFRGGGGTFPARLVSPERIEMGAALSDAKKAMQEFVRTEDGFVINNYDVGGGGRRFIGQYVLKPISVAQINEWRAHNLAAREAKARAEKRERGSGFLDALNLVAQGAAVAMGSYNNAYNGGPIAGAGGVENPLDPNSAQNRAFRHTLQQIGQQAAANTAARNANAAPGTSRPSSAGSANGGSVGQAANSPPRLPVAPPHPVAAAAPQAISAPNAPKTGRTIAYMLRVGVETKAGDTGNAECYSRVLTRSFPTWTERNGYEDLRGLLADEFGQLRRACVAAGRKPLAYDTEQVMTGFTADPGEAQRYVDGFRGHPELVQVSVR